MTRTELLRALIAHYGYQSYLEIGVRDPALNYDKVQAPKKIGVDPVVGSNHRRETLLRMKSDDFWTFFPTATFQLIFIDGDHSYEQAGLDIDNAVAHLAPGGTVVVHDVNPLHETWQGPGEPLGKSEVNPLNLWMGEVWKAWVEARTAFNSATVIVRDDIDSPADCGIIQPWNMKLPTMGHSDLTPQTYRVFDMDRRMWLYLLSWEELKERL